MVIKKNCSKCRKLIFTEVEIASKVPSLSFYYCIPCKELMNIEDKDNIFYVGAFCIKCDEDCRQNMTQEFMDSNKCDGCRGG